MSRARKSALLECFGGTLLLLLCLRAVGALCQALADGGSDRSRALWTLASAVIAEGSVLAVWIRWRRSRSRPIFLVAGQPGFRGWGAALALAIFATVPAWGGDHGSPLFEASAFNAIGSLLAGPGAGVLEELLFRGLAVAALAHGGFGTLGQWLLSSLAFGLSHAGWGLMAGSPMASLAAVAGTTVAGLLYGGVFLASRRHLAPVAMAHALGNLLVEPWLVLAALRGEFPGGPG